MTGKHFSTGSYTNISVHLNGRQILHHPAKELITATGFSCLYQIYREKKKKKIFQNHRSVTGTLIFRSWLRGQSVCIYLYTVAHMYFHSITRKKNSLFDVVAVYIQIVI